MEWINNTKRSAIDWLGKKVNKVKNFNVSSIPFEAHLPGYQFCGPGTNYESRVAQGQKGINALDNACMKHDAVYNSTGVKSDSNRLLRNQADDELIQQAVSFRKQSPRFADKAGALATEGAIRLKRKFGIY